MKQGTALVKKVVKKNPVAKNILDRLKKLGVSPTILKQLETSEEFAQEFSEEATGDNSSETDEAALDKLAQQIEALESIIGVDTRARLQNTRLSPYKRICHLKIKAADGKTFFGTGWFSGPNTIITAGHCVYLHGHGGWAKEIIVTPARDMSADSIPIEPFGTFKGTSFRTVQGWVNSKGSIYDYGAIVFNKNAGIPPTIGAFGYGVFSDNFLMNKTLNTAGYPGDKTGNERGTMWFDGKRTKKVTPFRIIYDIDTMPGQSGSPVYLKNGITGVSTAVGIHTNGSTGGNSATRITSKVMANLNKWRAESGK